MICHMEYNWQLAIISIPQGSITEPVLFTVFINNLKDVLECLTASSQMM